MKKQTIVALLVLVAGLVGCDHATKHAAQEELRGEPPVQLVSGVLDLQYAENRGVGFNVLRAVPEDIRRPLVLGAGLLALVLYVGFWYHRRRGRWYEHLAFAMVLGGALGNNIDRVFRGYVIDFVHLHYWPIFNAADVYLTVGVILLLLVQFRRHRTERAASDMMPAEDPG